MTGGKSERQEGRNALRVRGGGAPSVFARGLRIGTRGLKQVAFNPKNGDGLGGTGIKTAQLAPRGDGIGGTGVLGTISGFGSIIVNGLELEFNTSTSIATDGRPTSLQDLRIGQVVQGVARERDGKLTLDSVDIQHTVSGPITQIDHATQTMTVLGQRIKLNLGGDRAAISAFKTLQAGDAVSVSGLRLSDGTDRRHARRSAGR